MLSWIFAAKVEIITRSLMLTKSTLIELIFVILLKIGTLK